MKRKDKVFLNSLALSISGIPFVSGLYMMRDGASLTGILAVSLGVVTFIATIVMKPSTLTKS